MLGEHEILILFARGLGYLSLGVYSVLLAIFWGPLFVLRNVTRHFREIGVESWPRADGFITNPKVNAIHGWILDYALGKLEYTYRVHGEYYAGTMIRLFPDEQVAWNFVDAHREEPVVVRYRDDKPEVSNLLVADQGLGWMVNNGPGLIAQIWQHVRNEVGLIGAIRGVRQVYDLHRRQSVDSSRHQRARTLGRISPFKNDDSK